MTVRAVAKSAELGPPPPPPIPISALLSTPMYVYAYVCRYVSIYLCIYVLDCPHIHQAFGVRSFLL